MSRSEKFWFWLAWKLPRKLVYWCALRVCAYATQGYYSETYVPELTAMDALKRWECCQICGQTDKGQTGEHPCPGCGLPRTWDKEVCE